MIKRSSPHRQSLALPPAVRSRCAVLTAGETSERATPLGRLSAAMLVRAYRDCMRTHKATEANEAEAIRWLWSDERSYFLSAVACCERLGISIEVVRQVIERERNGQRGI